MHLHHEDVAVILWVMAVMGAPYALPNMIPPLLGVLMFWSGLIGLAVYFVWRFELLALIDPHHKLSLTEAARLIHDKASPRMRECIRRSASDSDEWAKTALIAAARQGLCTLYGRRDEVLSREQILSADLSTLWALEDNTLRDLLADRPAYFDVVVTRADAMRVLRQFGSEA